MNRFHSSPEWKYIPRWITPHLAGALEVHPVVVITGARQVGKSTLLQYGEPTQDFSFVSLDDMDVLAEAQKNPSALLTGKTRFIIDEVPKAPQLLPEIKRRVDATQRQVRIVLSGSTNLLMMKQISETLAGRAVFFSLDAMALREAHFLPPSGVLDALFAGKIPQAPEGELELDPLPELLIRGFLPPLLNIPGISEIVRWWEGYVTTFLERDLRTFSRIDSLPDFRRAMVAVALRSGQLLNQSEIARDIALPQPTLHRYLNLLEVMNILYRVPAFTINRTKRLMKSPKLYWFDCGLACFLAGLYEPEAVQGAREWGGLMETLIFQHLRVWCSLQVPSARIFFWRTTTGQEVDFVIEKGTCLLAIEVKSDSQVRYRDLGNLRLFLSEYPDLTAAGVVVYTGEEIVQLDEQIFAIPWHILV